MRAVLSALLGFGNYLNGGTNKGQADGFALGDLGKMSVTKDNANTVSLLEYAVQARALVGAIWLWVRKHCCCG